MVDELVEGSQPDNEAEPESTPTCHGVLNLKEKNVGLVHCTLPANRHLWIRHHNDSNRILYFCKGSHLVRYLFAKFNKQGCKPGQQERPAKKRKTDATKKKTAANKTAANKAAGKKAAEGKHEEAKKTKTASTDHNSEGEDDDGEGT